MISRKIQDKFPVIKKPVPQNDSKRPKPAGVPDFKEQSQNSTSAKVTTLALPNLSSSGYMHELDETVKSMMEKRENVNAQGRIMRYTCKVCGKKGQSIDVQQHIEANHMEGL